MAGVGEDEIAALVGLGIALGPPGTGALVDDGLEIVRHGVAMGGVAIPRLERDDLADLLADEFLREGDAGIETAVVADLEREPGSVNARAQFLALLDVHTERLLDENMFPRRDGLQGQRHMILVRHPDQHGFDLRVGQHLVIAVVGRARLVKHGHLLAQIIGQIADGIQLGVARLAAGVEVRDLRNRPAAENADAQEAGVFFHRSTDSLSASRCGTTDDSNGLADRLSALQWVEVAITIPGSAGATPHTTP